MGDPPNETVPPEYFERILPKAFINRDDVEQYDYLIVDEGQDLFRLNYLQCLNKLVKGGLNEGNWLIFYDNNQNIYNSNDQFDACLDKLKGYGAASFKLTINCRNTKQIADANTLTTGITVSVSKESYHQALVTVDKSVFDLAADETRRHVTVIRTFRQIEHDGLKRSMGHLGNRDKALVHVELTFMDYCGSTGSDNVRFGNDLLDKCGEVNGFLCIMNGGVDPDKDVTPFSIYY